MQECLPSMSSGNKGNSIWDHLAQISISVHGRQFPIFQSLGYTGFFLSLTQCLLLARHLGLSELTLLGVTGTVILVFYILMMITKILANREVMIYYHQEIAVIATSALFLRLTRQPVLPYLDVVVLSLGLFLGFGRVGCFMVGCCHGRPCRWGVRYGGNHVDAGFPRYLAGVTLFPIQAVESLLAFCLVGCGLFIILKPHAPGSVFLFYVVGYGYARFCFEFFRGDADRRYLFGFSEAQWTSCLVALCALGAARENLLPRSPWHLIGTVAMIAIAVVASIRRNVDRSRRFDFLHPMHVREISEALALMKLLPQEQAVEGSAKNVKILCIFQTSAGYQLSGSVRTSGSPVVEHCSISSRRNKLSEKTVRIFSTLLTQLEGHRGSSDLIRTSSGVFHVVFRRSEFTG